MAIETPPLEHDPTVERLLNEGAVVAISISGGKDSSAIAARTVEYLDEIEHTGPRVLIHSDLGEVEWRASLPACEDLAQRLDMELMVVRRAAGGLMVRWEQRWEANKARYAAMSLMKILAPWSTPALKFCQSEMKRDVISSALRKRWPRGPIVSAVGIRAEESSARSRMPVAAPSPKLTRRDGIGVTWNAILGWSKQQVFDYLALRGIPLHEAYTRYGASRVSCACCIFSTLNDLVAATRCADNHEIYRRMVRLESRSTFSFQQARWLADVAPHLLSAEEREANARARAAAQIRIAAEATLPPGLLYQQGWPTRMPTPEEAAHVAHVRRVVADACGLEIGVDTGEAVLERFAELIKARSASTTARAREIPIVPAQLFKPAEGVPCW
jgi:3'-phosphoadenosine 5'-phosphosulfate sulfotransferase (PAPS reductase)/FAD synthetase